jgi:transketolase
VEGLVVNTNKFLADYLNNPIKDANRKGFGIGLLKAGELNDNVVALCADLTESTQMHLFKEKFEDRFFDVGVAEQNLVTVGSGFALMGKIPFVSSYAAFSPGRNWEQIRTTVCLNDVPVKIIGSHAGVSVGPDGATHQMLEDIALMRSLPNMIVIAPADKVEAEKATLAIATNNKPSYMRLAREPVVTIFNDTYEFEIGKAYVLREGKDISIMATGTMTYQALIAAHNLEKSGINAEVIHVPTIKPLDIRTILSSAKKTNLVLTIEEAQVAAGFGSAVSEFLSEVYPVKIKRMGIEDHYGESGTPDELLKKFKLDYEHIELNVHHLLGR